MRASSFTEWVTAESYGTYAVRSGRVKASRRQGLKLSSRQEWLGRNPSHELVILSTSMFQDALREIVAVFGVFNWMRLDYTDVNSRKILVSAVNP